MEPNDLSPAALSERLNRLQSGIAAAVAGESAAVKHRAARQLEIRREMTRREEASGERLNAAIHGFAGIRLEESTVKPSAPKLSASAPSKPSTPPAPRLPAANSA